MRRPINQLYDDFFSSPSIESKKEVKKETTDAVIQKKFPDEEPFLEKYILGQQEAIHHLKIAFQRPLKMDEKFSTFLVCGPKGSGKHSLLKRYVEFLYAKSFLNAKNPFYIDLSQINDEMTLIQDIYSALQTSHQLIVFENIELCDISLLPIIIDLCKDGHLPLKQRFSSQKEKLTLASSQLEKDLVSSLQANHHYFAFLSHLSFSQLKHQLGKQRIEIIQDVIETKDLSEDVLVKLIHKDLTILSSQVKEQFSVTLNIEPEVVTFIISRYIKQEGYYSIINVINKIQQEVTTYLLNKTDTFSYLRVRNQTLYFNDRALLQEIQTHQLIAEIQKEMDEIVGLDTVKDYVYSLKNFIEISKRRQQLGLQTDQISMHMIFTGNPGTGKTTMARLIAKYLKSLNILKNGQLIEVTRADLVASYVGQTAPKTKKVIESSLGGILFIDEAYSLYRGKEDAFGLEAIDMLVKAMEDYRDQFVLILAGYTKEMTTFLEANSGLKSRFANVIEFPDYTAEQLLQIAISIASKKQYQITIEAQDKLLSYFKKVQALEDNRSGNGRLARNVVEDAILKQASRLSKDFNASLTELILDDFSLDV